MTTAMRRALRGGPFLLGILLVSLASDAIGPFAIGQGPSKGAGLAPERLEIRGIENAYRLSPNLYSGGDPHGLEPLRALKKLGIRTIISVDGVTPDVETAKKLGIRYVHLPISYDGVPRMQAVRMVQAVRTLPGPIYIHCHHGIHRGPAAVAVCGMASEGWSKERAVDWMKRAGTAADYRGLYASVRDFVPPSPKELEAAGADLPESSDVAALVEMMVKVDDRWDALKAVRKSGFKPPAARPEINPSADALQLLELFRESSRLPESKAKGSDFLNEMASAESLATTLHEATAKHEKHPSPDTLKALESAFAAAEKSCKSCHVKFRDN